MKIIAQVAGGRFLAEITEEEIARCCGVNSTYSDEWKNLISKNVGSSHDGRVKVGMEFHFKAISDWHNNLRYKDSKAKESAGFLRSLAEMIENLPAVYTVPPTEAEKAAAVADVPIDEGR